MLSTSGVIGWMAPVSSTSRRCTSLKKSISTVPRGEPSATTRPPLRATRTAIGYTAGFPVASRTTSAPLDGEAFRTSSATSSTLSGFTAMSAPRSVARRSRSSFRSMAIVGIAPARHASVNASCPTMPNPVIATLCPSSIPPLRTPRREIAVSTMKAASSAATPSGTGK